MSFRSGAPSSEPPNLYGNHNYHRNRQPIGTRTNFPSQQYQYSQRPSGRTSSSGGPQRPSSAGVTRDAGSGYSRNNSNTLNFMNDGNRGPGVVGSGYHTSSRPSSAGATRHYSSSKPRSSSSHHHSGGGSSSGYNTSNIPHTSNIHSSSNRSSSSSQRPKSASSTMKHSSDRHHSSSSSHQRDKLPNPNAPTNLAENIATTRLWSTQKHIVQSNAPSAANDMTSNTKTHVPTAPSNDPNHWSTSYKDHYNSSSGNGVNVPPFKLQQQKASSSNTTPMNTVPVQNHINMAEVIASSKHPSGQQTSNEKTSRVRSAIEQSQKFNISTNTGTNEGDDGEIAIDTENRGMGDEIEDFEGKPMVASQETRSQPEVSLTTPSQSTVLVGAPEGGIDTRNGSLDSFHEDKMSVGLSTVPNQFCSAREALELKKLLLLSNGSRGGIVPSSTAVMDMYMVGKVIGVGSYGKVRAAWHRLTGGKVAIKTYDKSKLKDPAHWKRVHSEIKITEQVSHPRIARMYEAVETPKRMHLIMECLDGGNLCSYVKAKRRLSEDESKTIFFQLMQAIEHLHTMRVTHRDVKLENVLFDTAESRDIKLIDFGFSTVCEPGSKLKVFCGTPSYMAPEIVRRTEYEGKPVDMWSMGVLLYALLCGCFPFRAKSYPDLYRRIARGTFAMPEELSVSVRDLIRQLLNVDASRRMTAAAALRHPWLQAPLAHAPDMGKLRLLTPILISDRAEDDIDDETLEQLSKFGLGKDELLRQIMNKTHSALATLYYLLLNVMVQKRRAVSHGRSSSGNSNRKSSSSSSMRMSSSSGHRSGNSNGHHNGHDNYMTQTGHSNGQTHIVQPVTHNTVQGLGAGMHRPRSASATRSSGHGTTRPLSAYTGRQRAQVQE